MKDKIANNIDKINKIIDITKNIKFPEFYSIYQVINYYYDKYIYLLSAKLFNQYNIYHECIDYEYDNVIKENKKRVFEILYLIMI